MKILQGQGRLCKSERQAKCHLLNGFAPGLEATVASAGNKLGRTRPSDEDTVQCEFPDPRVSAVYFQRSRQSRIFGEISPTAGC